MHIRLSYIHLTFFVQFNDRALNAINSRVHCMNLYQLASSLFHGYLDRECLKRQCLIRFLLSFSFPPPSPYSLIIPRLNTFSHLIFNYYLKITDSEMSESLTHKVTVLDIVSNNLTFNLFINITINVSCEYQFLPVSINPKVLFRSSLSIYIRNMFSKGIERNTYI